MRRQVALAALRGSSLCLKFRKTACLRARLSRFRASQSRDRKEAVRPPMAAQDVKTVAQVPDSSRDRKEAVGPPIAAEGDKAVAQVLDSRRDRSEAGFDIAC